MKKISKKQKIAIIISIIFFTTSVVVGIRKFAQDMNYVFFNKSNDKSLKNPDKNLNKTLKENNEIEDYILKLSNTLGEAIEYIKSNINDDKRIYDVKALIEDSIKALESIENALIKINDDKNTSNLLKHTQNLKESFKELRKSVEEENLNKAQQIMNSNIEKEYEKWKNEFIR